MRYLFILFLASCTTQSKVTAWLEKHPIEAATYCSEKFPPIITIDTFTTTDTVTNLEAIIYTDSLYFYTNDTIYKVIRDKIKPCVNKTITIQTTIIDSAKVVKLSGKLSIVQHELIDMTTTKNNYRKWFIILALCVIIYFIIKRLI
jgi:hypothetical protein